jgi:hypothetical protein
MKEELIKILPDLKQAVEQGIAYAGDLFNRAVSYYTILSIIGIVVGGLCMLGTLFGFYKMVKWFKNSDRDDELDPAWTLLLLPTLITVIILIESINAYLQLKFIPEIYILQLITN